MGLQAIKKPLDTEGLGVSALEAHSIGPDTAVHPWKCSALISVDLSLRLSHDRGVRLSGWDRTWAGTCPLMGMGAFLD